MHHCLVDGVRRLIWKDARAQARHKLLHLELAAALHHVVVHKNVVAKKLYTVLEVAAGVGWRSERVQGGFSSVRIYRLTKGRRQTQQDVYSV